MNRLICSLGLTVLATLSIPAFAQDSIAPPTFSTTIPIGTSATVNKVVTIGQVLKPVDILFLVDATGSMQPSISAIASDLTHAVSVVSAFAPNVQFGVANYLDGTAMYCSTDPYAYQFTQPITANQSLVQTALNNVALIPSSGYGCDIPESDVFGLQEAAITTNWRTGSLIPRA